MRLVIPAHPEGLLRSNKLLIRTHWDNGIGHGRPLRGWMQGGME